MIFIRRLPQANPRILLFGYERGRKGGFFREISEYCEGIAKIY